MADPTVLPASLWRARLVEVGDRPDLEGLNTLLVVKVADLAVDAHVHTHAPLSSLRKMGQSPKAEEEQPWSASGSLVAP